MMSTATNNICCPSSFPTTALSEMSSTTAEQHQQRHQQQENDAIDNDDDATTVLHSNPNRNDEEDQTPKNQSSDTTIPTGKSPNHNVFTNFYRKYNWVIPLSIGIFVSIFMMAQLLRPYEMIIERRSRPIQQRRVIQDLEFSLPSFPTSFRIQDWIGLSGDSHESGGIGRGLQYYDNEDNGDNGEENNEDEQAEEQENEDEQADEEEGENEYGEEYYQHNDDKDNVVDEEDEYNDDGKDNNEKEEENNYYNATNDDGNQTAYYKDDDYEAIVDDFFRYIDDSVDVRTVFPLEVQDYAGFICASFCIILCLGGGIGPGAILIAIFIIIMDLPPKVAIPMNCITLLGVTILSTFRNMHRRHPLSDRPIIDWDLVLIMEPLTLFGAIAGTYINKVLNQKILIVLLVLLLSLIAHNTLKKARKMHHAEELYIKRMLWAKQKRRNQKAPAPILATIPSVKSYDGKLEEADPPFIPKIHPSKTSTSKKASNSEPLLQKNKQDESVSRTDSNSHPSDSSYSSYSNSFHSFIVLHKADAESVKSSLIEEEAEPLPQHKITYISTMFLGVIAFNLFKGGASFESPIGIICGSYAFWFVEFLLTAWLGCCTFLAARYLLKRHAIKEAVGYDYVRGDIKWDVRTILIYPTACVFAGLVSGMFGIGCAVLIGPMLVGIGVNPSVASATCACMNFFTGLAAATSFLILGSLSLYHQYALVFFFVGIISMFIGRWVLSFSLHSTKINKTKRLERHSYMAYSMGLVVLVSALCMTVEALLDVVNHSYEDDEVDGICDQQMY